MSTAPIGSPSLNPLWPWNMPALLEADPSPPSRPPSKRSPGSEGGIHWAVPKVENVVCPQSGAAWGHPGTTPWIGVGSGSRGRAGCSELHLCASGLCPVLLPESSCNLDLIATGWAIAAPWPPIQQDLALRSLALNYCII